MLLEDAHDLAFMLSRPLPMGMRAVPIEDWVDGWGEGDGVPFEMPG